MKKIFLSLVLLITISPMFSQSAIEQELKALIKSETGYSWAETINADLKEGEKGYYWRTFYAGTDYAIFAFSEETGVYDVDIYLYDNDGTLLKKSTSTDDYEIVEYSPYTTRRMKVVIKNYDSYSKYSEYRLKFMIFYN